MNYNAFSSTIAPDVMQMVKDINNIEIDPAVRQRMLEILFKELGDNVYEVIYDMNAFDFGIWNTKGIGLDDRYIGLAKVVSDSVSLGGDTDEIIRQWINNAIIQAQHDSFITAQNFGKHPTVERRSSGGKTCKWCLARCGVFVEPTNDVFKRHDFCDCKIITSGYASRNGELKSYKTVDGRNRTKAGLRQQAERNTAQNG